MIEHLLLDLDNTLYPASSGMDEGITNRMTKFVADLLRVPIDEGQSMRAAALPGYGTTLEWLKSEHNLKDEQSYFNAVHPPSELTELQKDENLRPYLLSLKKPMTLLTNAPMAHAQRVLDFFGISDLFLGVFDITYHNGAGKPHPDSYLTTLAAVGHTVTDSLFVDDHMKYVRGYKEVGGKAVLVDETGKYETLAMSEGFGYIRNIYQLAEMLTEY